jgi:hypothetical protein
MIVEEFPEIQHLSLSRRLVLAAEILESATDSAPEEPDPEIVRILDERIAEHERDPAGGSPWSLFEARLLASREA